MFSSTPAPVPRDERPLVLEGLTKDYPRLRAVDSVDLTIEPGEIFALLGPNGAGKTTLIGSIAGLVRPTGGRVRVFGYDPVTEFRATRRLVGLVPQEIGFDPFFTPRESLRIQMGLMGVVPDERVIDDLLDRVSLTSHRDAYTRNLSGGMKRRMLVAKALVHGPRLLFLDEPTAGVDVELRKDLWRTVEGLRAQGTTVILTTHYIEEAERLADRVGFFHRGRLLLVRDRAALLNEYAQTELRLELDTDAPSLPDNLRERLTSVNGSRVVARLESPSEVAAVISAVSAHAGIRDVAMHRTSLEDIFVDIMRQADREVEA